jgi:hypothetical protein
MNPLTIPLPDDLYEKLTHRAKSVKTSVEELVVRRLRREFGAGLLNGETAKAQAVAFLRRRAGKCLTVREPILEEVDKPVWLVPVLTNVASASAAFVGQIVVDAKTGAVLNTESDIVEMIKKGHVSFGFEPFPPEKQNRLAELLASNQEDTLTAGEKREIEALLTEEQALQAQNLETLEKRLVS